MMNRRGSRKSVDGRGARFLARSLSFALALLSLTACAATTRVSHFGTLPNGSPLVTLILSEDQAAVRRECGADADRPGVLGCQMSYPISLDAGQQVRAVKVVRYTDALPSEMAQEIDAHEFCHVVASLQAIQDPCHNGNQGMVRAAMAARPRLTIEAR